MASSASKAIQDFNSSISQYGNIEDAVDNYVSQKRNEVYDSWKTGVLNKLNIDQEKKQQMDELISLTAGTASAAKGGYNAYQKYKAAKLAKKASGQTADDIAGGKSTGASSGSDLAGGKTASNTIEKTDGDLEMTKISPKASEAAAKSSSSTPSTQVVDDPEGASTTASSSSGSVPEANPSAAAGVSEETEQATETAEAASKAVSETAEKKIGTALAKNLGEDLADDAVTAGASSLLAGAAGAAGVALDVLGPVGMAAGLGLSLYDFFHHSKKEPKAPSSVLNPYISTALNQSGTLVLPSESAALDLVGGHSAF